MKREGKQRGGKREAEANPWVDQVKGTAIGVATSILLLGVCSVLVATAVVPERGIDGYVLGCCAVGAAIGTVSKGNRARRFLDGLCTGAAMAAVLGVTGLLLYRKLDAVWSAVVTVACVLSGTIVGMLGKRKVRKRKT